MSTHCRCIWDVWVFFFTEESRCSWYVIALGAGICKWLYHILIKTAQSSRGTCTWITITAEKVQKNTPVLCCLVTNLFNSKDHFILRENYLWESKVWVSSYCFWTKLLQLRRLETIIMSFLKNKKVCVIWLHCYYICLWFLRMLWWVKPSKG